MQPSMTATIPFGRWLDLGCPDTFDYDGLDLTAGQALSYEVEAIEDGIPPQVLSDTHCDALRIPRGSTNADAVAAVRSRHS